MLDNRIHTFLAVCQEMNFTRAAKRLHITQPAVSQHIQYIEDYYHIRAFRLEGKKLSLTQEGELLRNALLIMKNNEDSLQNALAESSGRTNPLQIGATLTAGSVLLTEPLVRIFRRWPDISLTVTVKTLRSSSARSTAELWTSLCWRETFQRLPTPTTPTSESLSSPSAGQGFLSAPPPPWMSFWENGCSCGNPAQVPG